MYLLEINDGSNNRECPERIYWELYETFYSDTIDQNKLAIAVKDITGNDFKLDKLALHNLIKNCEYYFDNNIKSNNYFSLSYKTWNRIEFYVDFFKKLKISLGLRLTNLRGQKSIVFSDLNYNFILNNK
jgi:hypothetical protein